MEKYLNYLVDWLKEKVELAHADGIVVGVSGGIDSAVVAGLIKKAFPNDSIGIIMPCYSSNEDVDHAKLVVEQFNLKHILINLDRTFDTLINQIENEIDISENFKLSKANTKARLRMTTLYNIAQNYNYLVCGTDNACEWYTGYFTKYGDGGVDIAPLLHLSKTQVYELARLLGVDEAIISKPPTAGLVENQTDEEEMQVSYKELEMFLVGEEINDKAKLRIEQLHRNSEHKRNLPLKPEKKVGEI